MSELSFITRFKNHQPSASNTVTKTTTVRLSGKEVAKLDKILHREAPNLTRTGLVTCMIQDCISRYEEQQGTLE